MKVEKIRGKVYLVKTHLYSLSTYAKDQTWHAESTNLTNSSELQVKHENDW